MIEEVEAKITKWLKEERFSPIKKENPDAYFHIEAKVGTLVLNVVQWTHYLDSLEVIVGLDYGEDQLTLLNELMDPVTRKRYYNSVHLELQRHPFVWNYRFGEGSKSIRLHSKRLYFDGLTKDAFMHIFLLMAKIFKLPVTLLEPYFDELWPGYEPPPPENRKASVEGL